MKCGVCGNILKPNETKCSVCGTSYDSATRLSSAMSNISSLASALKAKREIVNNNTKTYESELKKVAAIEEEMENLYAKDINLVVPEDEYEEEFDLNAFYEEAKIRDQSQDTMEESTDEPVEESAYVEEETEDKQESDDDQVGDDYVVLEESTLDRKNTESVEDTIDNASDNNQEEQVDEEESGEELEEESDSQEEELVIDEESEIESNEAQEENFVSIDLDDFDSSNDNAVITSGYIKESDINMESEEDQTEVEESANRFDLPPINTESVTEEKVEVDTEDNSQFVDFDTTSTTTKNVEQQPQVTQPEASQPQSESVAFAKIEPETVAVEVPQVEQKGEFDPVKAEDVPYTNMEEVKDSKVDNEHPIVIDAKDVVGASNANDTNIPVEDNSGNSSNSGKKPNRFFSAMAKMLLVLSLLVFAVVCANHFLLKDLEQTNVVFEFITTFFSSTQNLHYVILGTLGADALAIIFSFLQLVCVKPRKLGGIPLLCSIILAGAMAGLYFYLEYLMPAIDTLMAFFG